ncbi:MAG TPA: prepilin-type N-terminal cleavage/methylation domain-containing protein [Terriglobales bacterium]
MKTSFKKMRRRAQQNFQQGFSLLEVMISIMILMTGFVSLLGIFGLAMAVTQGAHQDLVAKQLASEAMESIFTARDTAQLDWTQIANTSDGGIFSNAQPFYPINQSGADGIIGTADDAAAGAVTVREPGPDGIVGTADDVIIPLSNYQRSITIAKAFDKANNEITSLRQVTITIQYTNPGIKTPKNYVLSSYISQYR